jgi:hypothetical protein
MPTGTGSGVRYAFASVAAVFLAGLHRAAATGMSTTLRGWGWVRWSVLWGGHGLSPEYGFPFLFYLAILLSYVC